MNCLKCTIELNLIIKREIVKIILYETTFLLENANIMALHINQQHV